MKEYVWYIPKYDIIVIQDKTGYEFKDKYGIHELWYNNDFITFPAYFIGEL